MKENQSYLTTVQWFNLFHCLYMPRRNIFYNGFYLVGSALIHKDFRDIDIRTVLPEEDFLQTEFTRKSISMWFSEWITNRLQFPVDFQIQTMGEFDSHKGPRMVIGETY